MSKRVCLGMSIFFVTLIALSLEPTSAQVYPVNLKDTPDRNPGEYYAQADLRVDHGEYVYENDPSCDGNPSLPINAVVNAFKALRLGGILQYAGPIFNEINTQLGQAIKDNIQGSLGEWLSVYTHPHANCAIVAVAIPADATLADQKFYAAEEGGTWQECGTDQICPVQFCRFVGKPGRDGQLFAIVFKNWSHNIPRLARLRIFFKPAPGWTPPR